MEDDKEPVVLVATTEVEPPAPEVHSTGSFNLAAFGEGV